MKIPTCFRAAFLKCLSSFHLHSKLVFSDIEKFGDLSIQVSHYIAPFLSMKGRIAFADLTYYDPGFSMRLILQNFIRKVCISIIRFLWGDIKS